MKNIELVLRKIGDIKNSNNSIKKAKAILIEKYQKRAMELESISIEKIDGYDFKSEVLRISIEITKLDYFMKTKYKKILGLNIHKFAPELNELNFIDGQTFRTPGITEIPKAINYLTAKMSLEQIESI